MQQQPTPHTTLPPDEECRLHVCTAIDHLKFALPLSPTAEVEAVLQRMIQSAQLVKHDLDSRLLRELYP